VRERRGSERRARGALAHLAKRFETGVIELMARIPPPTLMVEDDLAHHVYEHEVLRKRPYIDRLWCITVVEICSRPQTSRGRTDNTSLSRTRRKSEPLSVTMA